MVVRRSEVANAQYVLGGALLNRPAVLTPAAFARLEQDAAANPRLGTAGAQVLAGAYALARARAGGADPTVTQLRAELRRAIGRLNDESLAGRVNDGYVDGREAAASRHPLAASLHAFVDTSPAFANRPTSRAALRRSATAPQLERSLRRLGTVIDAGYAAYRRAGDPQNLGPREALRTAARQAGLSAKGQTALLTALSAVTSRSDSAGWPGAAQVKAMLERTQTALLGIDGAAVVDLEKPEQPPTRTLDGRITGAELDRSPEVLRSRTAAALLAFADTQ